MAFLAGLLFVCLHCVLFYHGATTRLDMAMAYLRTVLAGIAFITLVLSILLGQGSQELIPLAQPFFPRLAWGWDFESGGHCPSLAWPVLFLIYSCGMAARGLLGTHGLETFLSSAPGGVFFFHQSSQLQHGTALCEWVFVLDILIFYGTFSYEFGAVSSHTLVAALQPTPDRACKSSGSSSTSTHLNCAPESIAMI